MSLSRRGFFGVAAGAAVAGPSLAKEAAYKMAQTANASNAIGGDILGYPIGGLTDQIGLVESPLERAAHKLSLLRGLTKDQKAEVRRMVGPVRSELDLDPDLQSYRSISLAAKVQMQMDRNVERFLADRKNWWQRLFDNGGEPPEQVHYEL